MKKMLLSEIAEMLRKDMDEETIVRMIKNREVKEIEKNGYTTQQNYPNGVYVYASGEDLDGIMFGYRDDAEKLRKERIRAGLSMKVAAELSRTPYRTWQDWETGNRRVPGIAGAWLELYANQQRPESP